MASRAIATQSTGGAVAARQDGPYAQLRNQLETRADDFKMALPSHISPEKFQRTVLTAAQSNPDILKADRASLITACMKAAQDGLLPDGREAALVTFNTSKKIDGTWSKITLAQYMPMVFGLRKKILQSGEISAIETNVVYRAELESGAFLYEAGTEAMLRHRPMLDLTEEDTADENIVAAYSVAVMKDGTRSFEVMRRSDINKVRQTSQTGALGKSYQGKVIEPKGPWVDWFGEMARKTVMRRHSKTLPMSGDLLDVEAVDEALAARSTTTLLGGVEPDAPRLVPPTRDEVAAGDPPHDPDTGEITEEESAEDVARRLDREGLAQMDRNDGTLTDDNPAAAEGSDDSQRGEAHVESNPSADTADEMIDRVQRAALIADVMSVEKEFTGGVRLTLEVVDQDRVETAIEAAKMRLKAPAK